jgi:hypothetical protein
MFWVIVPVLSVQMIVVAPSVSTAGSLRMMAWRRTISRIPSARLTVTMAGSPSGTAAMARLTAMSSMSSQLNPRSTPATKTSAAQPQSDEAQVRPSSSSFSCSGVGGGCCDCISSAMLTDFRLHAGGDDDAAPPAVGNDRAAM